MKALKKLFASDDQMLFPMNDGTSTQQQLANRERLTDRTIRGVEASAMQKIRSAFRKDPELCEYALTHPDAVKTALATSYILTRHIKAGFTLIELCAAICVIAGLCVLGVAALS